MDFFQFDSLAIFALLNLLFLLSTTEYILIWIYILDQLSSSSFLLNPHLFKTKSPVCNIPFPIPPVFILSCPSLPLSDDVLYIFWHTCDCPPACAPALRLAHPSCVSISPSPGLSFHLAVFPLPLSVTWLSRTRQASLYDS